MAFAGWGLLLFLAIVGLGVMGRDFARPYKSATDQRARDFARWFWNNMDFGGETVCLKTDWNVQFVPAAYHEINWTAMYLCNLHIYSPRHVRKEPPDLARVSAAWPLRCVEFRAPAFDEDRAAREKWLDSMGDRYILVGEESFPFPATGKRDNRVNFLDYVTIYRFIPREETSRAEAAAAPRR
jgi:hypothetical protein